MKGIVLIWTSFFCCRHSSQSEGCWVPTFSSNGYSTDYWRWGDPGTYETVLGGEPGWETRLSRDKEDYAQSSREQRHVSCQLYDMKFAKYFVSARFLGLDGPCLIFWLNSFFVLQESLKQTWTKINGFCFQRLFMVFIWHRTCTKHSSVNGFQSWWNVLSLLWKVAFNFLECTKKKEKWRGNIEIPRPHQCVF